MSEPPVLPTRRPITLDDVYEIEWWDGYKKIEIVEWEWHFDGKPFYRGHGAISGWINLK